MTHRMTPSLVAHQELFRASMFCADELNSQKFCSAFTRFFVYLFYIKALFLHQHEICVVMYETPILRSNFS